jgi:hypothetical protein
MQNRLSFSGATVQAHRRCMGLPPLQAGEAERLMAEFLATRGVTVCPTRYAVPTAQRSHDERSVPFVA